MIEKSLKYTKKYVYKFKINIPISNDTVLISRSFNNKVVFCILKSKGPDDDDFVVEISRPWKQGLFNIGVLILKLYYKTNVWVHLLLIKVWLLRKRFAVEKGGYGK